MIINTQHLIVTENYSAFDSDKGIQHPDNDSDSYSASE